MSSPADGKTFRQLLSVALKRRLYPATGLHRKVLAHSVGVSRDTLDNWIDGNNEPAGGHLMALLRFFDPAFAMEISGGVVMRLPDRRSQDAAKQICEAMEVLR